MQLNNYLKSKMHFIGAFSLLFGLASCGSYQYVGQDDDGIYRTTERTAESHEIAEHQEETPAQGSSYYQNYFKEKSQELDNFQDEDLYFTDIDAYEGDYDVENDSITYQGNYTGWGQDNSDVTINVYGGHLFNSIYGNRPFYPSWTYNYGYGYGSLWGYGYTDSYWCPPYYGSIYAGWNSWNYGYPYYYGYRNRYYGNYYNRYNSYYNGRSLAYNSGRRGSIYNNSNLTGRTINRRNVTNRNTTSRRSTAIRNSNRLTSEVNTTRPRRVAQSTSTRTKTRTSTTRTRPRTTTTRPRTTTTRPRTTTTRPRTSTTRTRSSNNSSVNRSRSSSNVRSSSNSSRSSSRSSSSRSRSSRKGNN